MLAETVLKAIQRKRILIDRRKRSKALNEVKPVENIRNIRVFKG